MSVKNRAAVVLYESMVASIHDMLADLNEAAGNFPAPDGDVIPNGDYGDLGNVAEVHRLLGEAMGFIKSYRPVGAAARGAPCDDNAYLFRAPVNADKGRMIWVRGDENYDWVLREFVRVDCAGRFVCVDAEIRTVRVFWNCGLIWDGTMPVEKDVVSEVMDRGPCDDNDAEFRVPVDSDRGRMVWVKDVGSRWFRREFISKSGGRFLCKESSAPLGYVSWDVANIRVDSKPVEKADLGTIRVIT
jgi:hypothetical protein